MRVLIIGQSATVSKSKLDKFLAARCLCPPALTTAGNVSNVYFTRSSAVVENLAGPLQLQSPYALLSATFATK